MRDRLVELLNKKYDHFCDQCGVNKDSHYVENLADYLLENGVIVPPCKVGDAMYEIDLPEYGVIFCEATKVLCDSKVVVVNVIDGHGKGGEYYFDFADFGKTVFLTREEAEAKLKEGAE